MLELSDIQSSPEELQDYYAQLSAQHITPAWIGGGISVEPQSQAVPFVWHWQDLRPQAMRAAELVGTAQADFYRERCAAYGREPGAIVLRRDIYVGESSSEAQAVLQHALSRGYRGIPAEALIAGSVDEVAEQFRMFGEIGYTEILVRHLTNDQPKVLGSLERLAAVRAAVAQA